MKYGQLRIPVKEKISLIGNLATLLTAGIPLLEAVDSLLEESQGNQEKLLQVLKQDIIEGKRLHESLAKFPKVFNNVSVNLVKASEEAGTLDVTLVDLKKKLHQDMKFNDEIKSALFYPLVIMVVFFLVLLGILIFVVPKIGKVFMRLNVELPLPTRILIFTSNMILKYYLLIICLAAVVGVGLFALYRYQEDTIKRFLFGLPLVSGLMKQIDIARFARSLHLLLNSGIPIATALELAADVILKKKVKDLVIKARESALSGEKFSKGLKTKENVFPPVMVKLMEVGEQTGSLDSSLENISEQMDYRVKRALEKVTTLLEPIMLVMVGLAVGGLMLSIIAPIYGLISQVGNV